MTCVRIVSGGQTGVDRAALDTAIELAIGHGGWVPCGRATEDGALAAHYLLRETPDADPAQRTEWNVRDSDATLIVSCGPLRGGSELTRQVAERYGRPCLCLDLVTLPATEAAACIGQWLAGLHCTTLNIAGPRASEDPAIYTATRSLLPVVLADWARKTRRPADAPHDD